MGENERCPLIYAAEALFARPHVLVPSSPARLRSMQNLLDIQWVVGIKVRGRYPYAVEYWTRTLRARRRR